MHRGVQRDIGFKHRIMIGSDTHYCDCIVSIILFKQRNLINPNGKFKTSQIQFTYVSLVVSNPFSMYLLWVRDSQSTIDKTHLIIIFYIYRSLLVGQPFWRFDVRRAAYIVVSSKI